MMPARMATSTRESGTADGAAERDEAEIVSELARRVGAGDTVAEGELVAHFSRGLRYFLRRLVASPELAEDLHQESFRVVLERLRGRGIEDPRGVAGFLHGTARNLALAERRKAARRRTETGSEALERAAAPAADPLAEALAAERDRAVRRLIGELPVARDRELLWRFYVAEESKGRICADLDLDSLHFNRVLFRARQRFKELYERSEARDE